MVSDTGEMRIMHDRWTVVRDREGQPVAIEGFIRDNTSQQAFELTIHTSLIGCYIIQNGKFQYVNPKFTRIMGYGEDELK